MAAFDPSFDFIADSQFTSPIDRAIRELNMAQRDPEMINDGLLAVTTRDAAGAVIGGRLAAMDRRLTTMLWVDLAQLSRDCGGQVFAHAEHMPVEPGFTKTQLESLHFQVLPDRQGQRQVFRNEAPTTGQTPAGSRCPHRRGAA